MSVDLNNFEVLLREERALYTRILEKLNELIKAGRMKDGDKISEITSELITIESDASRREEEMTDLVHKTAEKIGIEPTNFKLSLLDKEGKYVSGIDELRRLVSEVARSAAEASGVLSANVEIIEETDKILESLDARAGGYGPEKAKPFSSKLLDRSA